MKGWRRQKKPPEGETDAQILERLVPKVTLTPVKVPPLLSELRKMQSEISQHGIDIDDALEITDIINQYA